MPSAKKKQRKKKVKQPGTANATHVVQTRPFHACRACKKLVPGCGHPGLPNFVCSNTKSKTDTTTDVVTTVKCNNSESCRAKSDHKDCPRIRNKASNKRKNTATDNGPTAATAPPLPMAVTPPDNGATLLVATTDQTTDQTTMNATQAAATVPPPEERTARCGYCCGLVPESSLVQRRGWNKTSRQGGDIVCNVCTTYSWCTHSNRCLCCNEFQNSYCLLHPPSKHLVDDTIDHVDQSLCSFCRATVQERNRRSREKNKLSQTLLSPAQREARQQLGMYMPTLSPLPTAKQTCLSEVSVPTLRAIWWFFLKHMRHTSNKHGKKDCFKTIKNNRKNRLNWSKMASRYKIFGTAGTHETGGEKLARLYHFITLKTTVVRIRRCSEHGVVDWKTVMKERGAMPSY